MFQAAKLHANDTPATTLQSVPKIIFLKNSEQITTLKQLNQYIGGKFVLADLWATWCAPCLEEFKQKEHHSALFKKYNIEKLYISFDSASDHAKWKSVVLQFNLTGTHIRADKQLKDDITQLIWGGIDVYSIPHYILLNEQMILVDKDLPLPSSGEFEKRIQADCSSER